jgi:hypothetical protein
MKKALFGLFVFSLLLSALPTAAAETSIPCTWTGVRNIVAVGDLHGDYNNFVVILRETGLVDGNLRWTGEETHFVQTGDIMDRGPGPRKIFDLMMRLEQEAEAAGGKVHVLIGNHEEMNITGIAFGYPEYIDVDQFLSFLPESYIQDRERAFLATQPPKIRAEYDGRPVDYRDDLFLRSFWTHVLRTDKTAHRVYVENFLSVYGPWLLRKNVVIRINDILFVHGGLSGEYAEWTLEEINDTARRELELYQGLGVGLNGGKTLPPPTLIYQSHGPLWHRDFALKDDEEFKDELLRVLDAFDAGRMVIAHTPFGGRGLSPVVSPQALARFEGRVWIIDTGISAFYGGALSALIIEDGWFSFWSAPPDYAEIQAEKDMSATPAPEHREIETFLREAEIVDIERTEVLGRTAPWIVWLDDGTRQSRAFFKHLDRKRPALMAQSYQYELAAYALNTLLGLDIVPPVVFRTIDDLPGSLQIYITGAMSEGSRRRKNIEPPDPAAFEKALAETRVFEALVHTPLCEPDDTLIVEENWKVFRVDFGEAFAPVKGLPEDCGIERCSFRLYQALRNLDKATLKNALEPFLSPEEIEALLVRRDLLVRHLQNLIAERGEGAVLFD